MRPEQRRQFQILYRDFASRLIDLDVLTAGGEARNLFAQFGAILAAASFVIAITIVPRYGLSPKPWTRLLLLAWSDEQFLLSTSMAVAGLFAVLAWNSVLPDRRESYVLGVLPIRTRTLFAAKLAAIGSGLALGVLAVNAFTGVTFPLAIGDARCFIAYWAATFAGGLFVYSALLALQGVVAQLLPYRLFLRVSNVLQLAIFFVILSLYFLAPYYTSLKEFTSNRAIIETLPQFWFFGLFQWLNGNGGDPFTSLALRAMYGFLLAATTAVTTLALAYRRNMRRIIETPDIAPGDRRNLRMRSSRLVAGQVLAKPFERAIVLFIARTISRSRQHRLILAVYGGIGLAIAFAYAKNLIYGSLEPSWRQVTKPGLIFSTVLLCFAIFGARAIFSLPVNLPANWIFRMTAVHSPAAYFASIRKALYFVAVVPVCFFWGIFYSAVWSSAPAWEHLLFLAGTGMLLVELSLYRFRKIPFACSYLPGKSNISMKIGVWGTLFLVAIDLSGGLEFWAMGKPARFIVLAMVLFASAIWARRRTTEFARAPFNSVEFEELPADQISVLDLRRDGAWSSEQAYVDAIDPTFGKPLAARILRPVALGLVALLLCGMLYERVGEWKDRRLYPQVGHSVDIGGRTLNLFCSGQGQPTVVFDSAHGAPGYSWLLVQREVAKFTRACWYDRAGLGWSDPSPHLNTADAAARDLHALLKSAGIPGPYLLTGASRGGFNVRVYRSLYPDEVAGMVLVDASHEDIRARIPDVPHQSPPIDTNPRVWVHASEGLAAIGFLRLLAPEPDRSTPGFTQHESGILQYLQVRPESLVASANEGPERMSAEQARAAGGFGDLPLIVLTAGAGSNERQQAAWIQLQRELAQRSTRGKQYVVARSGHMIQEAAPEAVIQAVQELTALLRTAPADLHAPL